ncbi:hypothetical protein pb186bvf_013283 [Paramecium bursaria]
MILLFIIQAKGLGIYGLDSTVEIQKRSCLPQCGTLHFLNRLFTFEQLG